jgi:TonB family protein
MIDTLTQPTARLDRSRAVTLLDPTVERRNRRWAPQAVNEEAADPSEPAPTERSSAALSDRSRKEPFRPATDPQSETAFPEMSARNAAAAAASSPTVGDQTGGQGSSARQAGLGEVPGSQSRPPAPRDAPKPQQVSARPAAARLRSEGPDVEAPELPARTSSTLSSEPPREKGRTPSPLRMAGFPEACVEQPVVRDGPEGRTAAAGFPKAAPGSDSAANRSLLAGRAGAAAHEDAFADATGALTTPVQILFKPRPRYPEEALRHRLQGDVLLDVEFRYSGSLEVLGVRRGLGHGLNESAIEAARKLRFVPARRDGRPVDTQATLRIRFQLLQ